MARAIADMLADVFAFESLSDTRITPDGQRIIAILTRRDIRSDSRIPRLILSDGRGPWRELPDTAGVIAARLAATFSSKRAAYSARISSSGRKWRRKPIC